MKFLIILIFGLLIYGCNRIDFSGQGYKNPRNYVTDYQLYSCKDNNCQDGAFAAGQHESKKGYLTEYFKIARRDDLEIILVVDASSSMDDDLQAIGSNMVALLSHVKEKKWRMVFITADHGDQNKNHPEQSERWQDWHGATPRFGQFMPLEIKGSIGNKRILDKKDSSYEKIFRDTLTRDSSDGCSLPPFCQGYNEQPLRALKAAIQRVETGGVYKKFFKPDTDTVVIIITDEDERRHDSLGATTATEVLQTYSRQFKGQKKRLFGFSISVQDDTCFEQEEHRGWFTTTATTYGRMVGRLADITGGSNISLCDKNYSLSLHDISERTRRLMHSVTLREMFYIPETVKVSLQPEQPGISWQLYGRSLVFSGDLQSDTKVTVQYKYER